MRIVADENVDKHIVDVLRKQGHDVQYVAELDPGIDDETVLFQTRDLNAILLTGDKDFGELVFRQGLLHSGILLMRLGGLTPEQRAATVAAVFDSHGMVLTASFAVVSERVLRIRPMRS